jgi:hypothetical protein
VTVIAIIDHRSVCDYYNMNRAIVTIPHGFLNNGSWLNKAEIRQLDGYDEQYLQEIWNYPLPFRITALLERVIINFENVIIGGVNQNSNDDYYHNIRELIRHLTVGDRVALMLHLRRLTFGDKIQCTIVCPACKEAMSLDTPASNLIQPPILQPKSEYIVNTDNNFVLTLRPITGADQESLFEKKDDDLDDLQSHNQTEMLIRSCITSSDPPLPDNLTDDFLGMASSKLEELDPQANLIFDICCPVCQHSFQASFNTEDYIFQEIYANHKQLEREVHWLAFNYHWSEDSILSLPIKKRKRYVELINKTLSGDGI